MACSGLAQLLSKRFPHLHFEVTESPQYGEILVAVGPVPQEVFAEVDAFCRAIVPAHLTIRYV